MNTTKFKNLVDSFNAAPSGSFVGITDYESSNGDVLSITGQVGCSYGDSKTLAIAELKKAIDNKTFEAITVSGQAWQNPDGTLSNRKSNARTLVNFNEVYTAEQVTAYAKEILAAWEKPSTRKNNKVSLTEKENGLSYNQETGSFNFSLMVINETYKEDKSNEAKAGRQVVQKATLPETALKKEIRGMFEKKIKTFTIAEGKFVSLSIAGQKFLSENITF